MPCFKPLQAWAIKSASTGKKILQFSDPNSSNWEHLTLPCGQCVGCRLERSRQWAIRCVHEASLYENNCFITLTFNDENLLKRDNPMSLDVRDFQKFMKRLRKEFGNGIRFYHCGEYGDRYSRPHYHACLFNFTFPDLLLWKEVNGFRLYTSEILSRLWPYGYSSVGSVTFESAAYVARYIMKKITGKSADEFYQFIDFDSGEWYQRKSEYTTMSRKPGIGSGWFDKWGMVDTYPNDYVVMRGRKMRPPRYYDTKLDADFLDVIKSSRLEKVLEFTEDQTYRRLIDREKCAIAKLRLFSRNVE